MARDRWSSRTTFILGAVGSAVGLGNLWRFPFLVFDWGGGTFLIPYLICLFFIGVPILLMEVTLGRTFQGGDPVCFASMHPRLVGIGWMSAYGSFLLAIYYPVLVAWIVIFFFKSFQSPLPWALDKSANGTDQLGGALNFFAGTVLKDSGSIAVQETINPIVMVALIFTWLCVFFSIYKGVKVVSQVVKVSVPVPILTLAILLFNSVGREGARDGITAYIGSWDTTLLDDPKIWQAAVGQVFFSIGVCFGIMTAYSSYMESKKGLFQDSLLIALVDSAVSFFAGFVVFTAVGVLAHDLGVEMTDDKFKSRIQGATLVFVAYPAAIATLDTAPQAFSAIFFLTVFFLAIDSAFSIVEAVIASIHDTNVGRSMPRPKITFIVCFAAFCFGIFIAADNGSYFLDIIDYYLNNFIMLGVGALECMAVMWVYGFKESCEKFGHKAMFVWTIGYVVATFMSIIMITAVEYNNIALAFLVWPLITAVSFVAAMSLSPQMPNKGYELLFSGGAHKIMDIMIVDESGSWEQSGKVFRGVLHTWAFLAKYLIPTFLTMLMLTGAKKNFEEPYGGYPAVFQNLGNVIVLIGWGILFLFMYVKVDVYGDRVAEYHERMEKREEALQEAAAEKEAAATEAAVGVDETPVPAAQVEEEEVKGEL